MSFKIYIYFLNLVLFLGISVHGYNLKSLNVIFRHGDRTPIGASNGESYPKDPYVNATFYPAGYGALTNAGKLREYEIGESLRKRYIDFLGSTYLPNEVSTHSTDTQRTKMSALLVLAGLYPPKDKQVWNEDLNWQPIPVVNPPNFLDANFKSSACPVYRAELNRVKHSPEYLKEQSQFDKLMKELAFFTGKTYNDTEQVFYLYHLLTAELASKLVLPSWTKKYYPNGPMRNATLFEYHAMSYNNILKTFNGGMAIKKVLNNMNEHINEKSENKMKIHLYGAHETNIAGILVALDVWKKFIPEYSSTIIFELHEKYSNYYIRLVYYKGVPPEFEVLVIPGCTEYCQIDQFIKLNSDILPDNVMETCFGPATNSKLVPEKENPIKWMYKQFQAWFDM